MRIFKATYSKPLQKGAKIISRKGVKFAEYKTRRGNEKERLTQAGDKILCEVKVYSIQFQDKHDIKRVVKAYTNERETQKLADTIEELLNGKEPDAEWIENLMPRVRDSLIEFGLIDTNKAQIGKPLTEHIA